MAIRAIFLILVFLLIVLPVYMVAFAKLSPWVVTSMDLGFFIF